MNWDAIGAVGEVLGAAGVIITLLYLARQIHVSNRAESRARAQEGLDQTLTFETLAYVHNIVGMIERSMTGGIYEMPEPDLPPVIERPGPPRAGDRFR